MMVQDVEQLLRSRRLAEKRARLHRVGEELRKRVALALKAPLATQEPPINAVAKNHTQQFNRILRLWIDMDRAVAKARFAGTTKRESVLAPWDCEDAEICDLWEQITRPENFSLLLEWLRQSASGEGEIWAQQAVEECQLRFEEEDF